MKKYKKKKNRRKLLIIIVLIILIGLGLFIKFKSLDVKYEKIVVVNLNDEVYDNDNINIVKNGSFVNEKVKLDTSKVGEQEVKVVIKNAFNMKKNFSYKLEVKDGSGPVITFKNLSTEVGKEIDLLNGVSATDDSGENIDVKVEGNYDFNTVGDYKLYYVAKDSSGNETKEEFTLTVSKKVAVSGDARIMPDRTFKTSKGYSGYTKNGLTYIDGYLVANKTYYLPSTYNPGLDSTVQSQANLMFADAKAVGLNIYLSSGFRSYSTQKTLYNNYVKSDGRANADRYSARPGHSEHQTGLAADINKISYTWHTTKDGSWLYNNCYKYGFIIRYTKNGESKTGYKFEPWHIRYVGVDIATKLYNKGNWISLEEYLGITSKYQ